MRIVQAREMGLCFGVRDALAAAAEIAEPESVTVHGELVHNEEVIDDLQRMEETLPLNYLMCAPLSHSSFMLFTEKVMPHFQDTAPHSAIAAD